MTDDHYAEYSIYLAVLFAGVYFVNLAYMKLLNMDRIDPVGGFEGLINTDQVVVIFIMSISFVIHVIHAKKKEETTEGN
jgi:hypothetical protein